MKCNYNEVSYTSSLFHLSLPGEGYTVSAAKDLILVSVLAIWIRPLENLIEEIPVVLSQDESLSLTFCA